MFLIFASLLTLLKGFGPRSARPLLPTPPKPSAASGSPSPLSKNPSSDPWTLSRLGTHRRPKNYPQNRSSPPPALPLVRMHPQLKKKKGALLLRNITVFPYLGLGFFLPYIVFLFATEKLPPLKSEKGGGGGIAKSFVNGDHGTGADSSKPKPGRSR